MVKKSQNPPASPPAKQLDARGLKCPEPLMLVRNQVRAMAAGECLEVRATDPTTTRDLENFCRFMKHEMISSDTEGDEFVYLIRKGEGTAG